jgi:hypothetical protein
MPSMKILAAMATQLARAGRALIGPRFTYSRGKKRKVFFWEGMGFIVKAACWQYLQLIRTTCGLRLVVCWCRRSGCNWLQPLLMCCFSNSGQPKWNRFTVSCLGRKGQLTGGWDTRNLASLGNGLLQPHSSRSWIVISYFMLCLNPLGVFFDHIEPSDVYAEGTWSEPCPRHGLSWLRDLGSHQYFQISAARIRLLWNRPRPLFRPFAFRVMDSVVR